MHPDVQAFKNRNIDLPVLKGFTWNGKELSDDHWAQLYERVNARQIKKLSNTRLIQFLSEILGTDYDTIKTSLQRRQVDRACKQVLAVETEPTHSRRKRPFEREYEQDKENQDPQQQLIIDANSLTPQKIQKLEKLKVRVTPLTSASPVKGYGRAATVLTPGKSVAYQVYAKETKVKSIADENSVYQCRLFKKVTPMKDKSGRGREKISDLKAKEVKDKIPGLVSKQIQPLEYTVTLKDIQKTSKKGRRFGQNGLAGASCREVFEAYGADTIIKPKGSDYHWNHIRGLCIGGQHSSEHLFPATAASNYSTLLIVENFIIDKLSEEREFPIEQINIKVTPVYSKDSEVLIPEVINFELTWEEINSDLEIISKKEIINLSARSNLKLNQNARAAIDFMRKDKGIEEELTNTSNKIL
ncbi:hypothetical protein ACQUW5_11955 [Legionella sp. CNM-1927-20]|uniref:hypothetical protein n=1 Tax=Legionella sp. CNM-1927-20 TaxID=3422221 RepID=UPI00403AE898